MPVMWGSVLLREVRKVRKAGPVHLRGLSRFERSENAGRFLGERLMSDTME